MNISEDQLKKIFELASMENKLKKNVISENDISEALIAIERKIYSFATDVQTEKITNKKILIADDLELSIYQLSTLLKKIGVDPNIARNKEEAISELQKIHFDCVIIDLFMPDSSDGFALIKEAVNKRNESNTASSVVVISGTDDVSLVDNCYQMGVDFYIQKDSDWHSKLLKYLSTIFQTDSSNSFSKYTVRDIAVYQIRKLHEAKVFNEIAKSVNSSMYSGVKNIVFDLSEISTFDVENAYIFADIYKICAEHGGKLVLVKPSPSVKEALEFAYLSDVIQYAETEEDALKLF